MGSRDIAIVGAACRFPGAPDLDAFWTLLANGRDAVTEIPDDRWAKDFFFHPTKGQPGKSYTWAAGILDQVDRFDAGFFGISPREARQMDPQQRLLLEVAWEAIENAGLTAAGLAGSDTGVYIGVAGTDYATQRLGDPASGDAYFMTGITNSIAANRLSYVFDLKGPSFAVDTACSSSLVALHQACEALRHGEAKMAIVGGVNLLLAPFAFMGFCAASMLSPRGRCHAFDARADGYVRAEGAGAVILKPLDEAIADGDPIRAVIRGSGVNSDGHTMGLSLPNEAAQAALLEKVYGEAGVDPDALTFIEAHGTGTLVGDPIELHALGRSLARHRTAPLPIGSVKTNIGHLETASGMAGLIKAILAFEHRLLPASLHFETPNPHIPFEKLGLEVVARARPLPASELLAGVNSFGFGGTNAHVILASAPAPAPAAPAQTDALPPLLLSARSSAALADLAGTWSQQLAARSLPQASALLRAQARRRDHHRHRLHATATTPAELAVRLADFTSGVRAEGIATGQAVSQARIAFVYSGNGAQFLGMARDALDHNDAFRAKLAKVDAHLAKLLGWSVAARLLDEDPVLLARTDVAQPLLFAVQVAITAALDAEGIRPDMTLGHSVGEIAAAWASGALSLDAACRIVASRSHQQHRTQGAGKMAALSLPAEAQEQIADIDERIEVAAFNSRSNITVAGPQDALAKLEAAARDNGWRYTGLDLDYAFHSSALEPIHDDLLQALGVIAGHDGGARFISTVTGEQIGGTALNARYWWRNVREPVRFRQAVAEAVKAGARLLLEIGPNPILQSYLRDGLKAADTDGRVLSTLMRPTPNNPQQGRDPFSAIAANCYVAGAALAHQPIFDGPADIAGLPRTPWQRESHWYPQTSEAGGAIEPCHEHPLLGFHTHGEGMQWSQTLDLALQPWLADHAVEGVAVVPAAAIAEIALEAAHRLQGDDGLRLSELEIRQALTLEEGRGRTVRVRLEDGAVTIESRQRLGDESWALHAVARLAPDAAGPAPRLVEGAAVRDAIDADTLYARAEALGLNYGPQFRSVRRVEMLADGSAHAVLTPQDGFAGYLLAPPLLDGALQAFLGLLSDSTAKSDHSLLPWRFTGIRLFAPLGRTPSQVRLAVTHRGVRAARGAITLYDADGVAVVDIAECWFRQVRLARSQSVAERAFHFEALAKPLPTDDAAPPIVPAMLLEGPADARSNDNALLLEGYVVSAAREVFAALAPGGNPFTLSDLTMRGVLAPEAAPLANYLLGLLADHGAAVEEQWQWRLPQDSDLPQAQMIWRTLLSEDPALTAELALAVAATDALPDFLAHGIPTALPPALLEQFHHASHAGRCSGEALRHAVLGLAAHWPQGRPLRILEVGAGSGILARAMIDALAHWPGTLSYVAVDADPVQAARLTALPAARPDSQDRIRCLQWNPQSDTAEALGGRFDLVLSAGALSRAGASQIALSALHQALAPGGVLLAAEPAPNALWNWILGQQADWWRDSVSADFPLSPLKSETVWMQALESAGFSAPVSRAMGDGAWPLALIAAERGAQAMVTAAPATNSVVVVVAEAHALSSALVEALRSAGASVQMVVPPQTGDGQDYCRMLAAVPEQLMDVVVLPGHSDGGTDAVTATNTRLMQVLAVARLTAATRDKARLWIVTENAQQDGPARGDCAEDAALWGLGRTIANEMPHLQCRLVDLSGALTPDDAAARLADDVVRGDDETEILFTPQGRSVLRLKRGTGMPRRADGPLALAAKTPGRLDSLVWEPQQVTQPGPGEIAITVKTVDVNFRDVMWALDLLPEEALMGGYGGPNMGLACAGIVRAVGEGVHHVAPGDAVLATAPATFASDVIAKAHTVTKLPPGLDFAAAATLPVAFVTVLYALGTLANLKAGETVLIHGGAGGVGLAAIQVARHRGATVIATAGSPAKRAFLKAVGADHVLDSRSLAFGDQVRALTNGEGVDVVLNSLNGEAMELSLSLVKPFGRFLELGKRDFFSGTRIGLKPLRRNVSYFAVDVDALPLERPEISVALMDELVTLLESGALRPLPYRLFRRGDAGDALRLMQAAGHIGKIVLTMEDGEAFAAPARDVPVMTITGNATYLVTGGLGGFGLATAQWLVARGARALALVGRRGIETPGAAEALADLQAAGVDARAFACDAADDTALAGVLETIRDQMPPLKGIVHAAMALDDSLLDGLDAEKNVRVLSPKLGGALALDRLTRADALDFFLLYSSATTVLGAPGQGNYVCANFALEGVARRRRAEGLPAFVVGWGPIADAGYLARNAQAGEMLSRRLAANPIAAMESLDALPELMAGGALSVAFASVRWDTAQRLLPVLQAPAFAGVVGARQEAGENDLREKLMAMPPDACKAALLGVLTQEVARILSTGAELLDPNRPVAELGMDSLMAVEMRLAVEQRIGVSLPMFSLSPQTSLAMIAARIARDLAAPDTGGGDLATMAQRYETAAADIAVPAAIGATNAVAAQ